AFTPAIFHPNVFSTGSICLSILDPGNGWKPSITIKQILLGIQDLLDNPNPNSPAQQEAYAAYIRDRPRYEAIVKQNALLYTSNEL
ncbi:hypothetical protein MXB_2692, partial [Myxobolus squamalis]